MATAVRASTYVTEEITTTRPSLWRNRTFLFIWIGHVISILGSGFNSVALGLWVLQTTGSASAMAVIMSVRVVIGILLGAVAGTVVDRTDRRKLMVAMDLARFVTVGAVAWMITLENTPFAAVVALTGLTSVASVFFGPAFQASLVNIVDKEEIPRASSLLQVSNTLAQVAGPFLGGAVVALFGGWVALSGDAVSFLISGLMILAAGAFASPGGNSKQANSFWADMKEGIQFVRRDSLVSSIVLMAPIINFFGNAIGILLPVIAIRIWLASPMQFGIIESVSPLGFAVGAGAIMALASKIRRRGWWMMGGTILAGITISAVAVAPSVYASLPFLLLSGIALAIINVLFQITLQSEVPADVQGRVFGTLGSLVNVASPASMLVAGYLGDVLNPVYIMVVAGLMISVTAIGSLVAFPALRRYN